MNQSDRSQGKLMQDKEGQAILAFLEYIEAFQEAIGKAPVASFDTGDYHVEDSTSSHVLYYLAEILDNALHKKTPARVGTKLIGLGHLEDFVHYYISTFLGISNLVAFTDRNAFSLALLLNERPGGFLEPLPDKEWQALSDKAVADMLNRRQWAERGGLNETDTNFTGEPGKYHAYFGSTKRYRFANNEAKYAAEAIVAAEKVRLTLFLDALQGTLRFLDRVTRLPDYIEKQIPREERTRYSYDFQKDVRMIANGIISIFRAFLDEDTKKQEVTPQKGAPTLVVGKVTASTKVALQVRKEEHKGNLHTYHLTLTDSKHLSEPVLFLLQVSESGEAELFEDESNG